MSSYAKIKEQLSRLPAPSPPPLPDPSRLFAEEEPGTNRYRLTDQTIQLLLRWRDREWSTIPSEEIERMVTFDFIIRHVLLRYQELADKLDRLHQDSTPL